MRIQPSAFGRGHFATSITFVPRNFPARFVRPHFAVFKHVVDVVFAVLALPFILILAAFLLFANRFWNPGPVFFRQKRMGRGGKSFTIWKFRTMVECGSGLRDADAPLETHRVTPLGRFLRSTRLDELPNAINVLMGDMSLVGPRPDAFEHASQYLGRVPRYQERFSVRPGITGLAQVRAGYADTRRAVQRKARYDSYYIRNASPLMDLFIIASTFSVVLSPFTSR